MLHIAGRVSENVPGRCDEQDAPKDKKPSIFAIVDDVMELIAVQSAEMKQGAREIAASLSALAGFYGGCNYPPQRTPGPPQAR